MVLSGINVFNLTSPYDISTCTEFKKQTHLDYFVLTHGSKAGDYR